MAPAPRPIAERFWSHVDKDGPIIRAELGPCWVWTGALKGNGYGAFGDDEHKTRYAHRIAYQLQIGPIPPGKLVMHKCDNRPCVRGFHLVTGTHSDNSRDMIAKGRRIEYDRSGINNPRAILDERKVTMIRALRKEGRTLSSLAAEFGVHISTIGGIVYGKNWSAVRAA